MKGANTWSSLPLLERHVTCSCDVDHRQSILRTCVLLGVKVSTSCLWEEAICAFFHQNNKAQLVFQFKSKSIHLEVISKVFQCKHSHLDIWYWHCQVMVNICLINGITTKDDNCYPKHTPMLMFVFLFFLRNYYCNIVGASNIFSMITQTCAHNYSFFHINNNHISMKTWTCRFNCNFFML